MSTDVDLRDLRFEEELDENSQDACQDDTPDAENSIDLDNPPTTDASDSDWLKTTRCNILNGSNDDHVGYINILIMDRDLIEANEFRSITSQGGQDIAMLARTLFDDYGMVDAEVAKDEVARNVLDEQPVVYIQEIHLQERYQRTGVFKWILQNVSSLEALKAASIENELEKCRSSAEFASSAEPAKSIIAQPTVFYASEIAGGPSSPNGSIRTGDNHEAQGRQKDLEDDHHKAFVQFGFQRIANTSYYFYNLAGEENDRQ